MKVRLKDVAQRAGVAVNTASMILNKRPNCWASKKTGERVFKAAAELRYKPSRTAVALRLGRFQTVGLLVPELQNPHWAAFAQLLQLEFQKHGYDLMIESSHSNAERERDCLEAMLDRQIDGLIACLSRSEPYQSFLEGQSSSTKPVLVLSQKSKAVLPVDSISLDLHTGRSQAVAHLAELGHKQVAVLLAENEEPLPASESLNLSHVNCAANLSAAYETTKELLSSAQRPTAVLAHNDITALGVIRAAADNGLQVPHNLSVIGFDNTALGRFLPVSLTSLEHPTQQIVENATEIMLKRMKGLHPGQPECLHFTPTLVCRESTTKVPR